MAIDVYLYFNGNCREALKFYSEVFNCSPPAITEYGDQPSEDMPMPEDTKGLVLNASLNIMGSNVMFSDVSPGTPFTVGNNICLTASSKHIDEIRSVFNKLSEGAEIYMELQETFFSKCFGYLNDRFGVGWMLNYEGE